MSPARRAARSARAPRRRPTLHLIDASPYVFRAWFSVPDSLRAPDGRPINALHGFAGFLLRYLAEERPTHLALAFDRSLDSTRFRTQFNYAPPSWPQMIDELATEVRAIAR